MWTKNKPYHVRTKDKYAAVGKWSDARPDDLQALREDSKAGCAAVLKKVMRSGAAKSRKEGSNSNFAALRAVARCALRVKINLLFAV
jgi:hypothetical protein